MREEVLVVGVDWNHLVANGTVARVGSMKPAVVQLQFR